MLSSAAAISLLTPKRSNSPVSRASSRTRATSSGWLCAEELDHLFVELLAVDPQRVEVGAEEVAHGAQREAEIAVEQARRARRGRAPLDAAPTPTRGRRRRRSRSSTVAPSASVRAMQPGRRQASLCARIDAQAGALGLVLDPPRDAEVRRAGKEHQVAAGQRDVRAHPRALAGERVLAHLDHDLLPLLEQVDDRRTRRGRRQRPLADPRRRFRRPRAFRSSRDAARPRRIVRCAVGVVRAVVVDHRVAHVEEGVALEAEIDERRLHAGQHARHAALVQVADQAAVAVALERELGEAVVLEHGDPRLVRIALDQERLLDGQRFTQRRKSTPRMRPVTKKLHIVNEPP